MTLDLPVLPEGFERLAFDGRRGLPQSASFTADGRTVRCTIVAIAADLPALLEAEAAAPLLDPGGVESARRTDGPGSDPRALFRLPAPDSLSDGAVRAYLVVHERGRVLASEPVVVGRPMQIARTGSGFMELFVAACSVRTGSLIRPSDLGTTILVGARSRLAGTPRFERAVPAKEDPHDTLV